jgi:hypothetical protein
MFRSFTLTTITWFALSGLFPVMATGAPLEPQTSFSKIDLRVPSAHEIQRLTLATAPRSTVPSSRSPTIPSPSAR